MTTPRATLHLVTEQREPRSMALPPARIEPSIGREIERLALLETEGNVSQMLRKLVREALEARGANAAAS